MVLHQGALLAVFLIMAMALAGCEGALFKLRHERSPYERYQWLHGKYRPAKEINSLGGEQPALRARLKPLD